MFKMFKRKPVVSLNQAVKQLKIDPRDLREKRRAANTAGARG